MEYTNIYSMYDPLYPNDIRYIGKTIMKINLRLNSHVRDSKLSINRYCINWMKKVLREGRKPVIELIDVVETSNWKFWEIYWIAQFKAWGFELTNLTEGGDGTLGYRHTDKFKNDLSIRLKGKPSNVPKETRERMNKEHSVWMKNNKNNVFINASLDVKKEWLRKATKASSKALSKTVFETSKSGELLKSYTSASEIAKEMNCDPSIICTVARERDKGKNKSYKNRYFNYTFNSKS